MDDYRLLRLLEGRPLKDDRKRGPRGRKGGKKKTTWQRRNIIAWDGEGANLADGTHIYNLLANSFGHYIINHEGLSTEQVLNFMLSESKPQAINVIFGGSYDVNMLLRDLPTDKVQTLWDKGTVYWKNYGISYAHRKRFSVRWYDYNAGKKPTHTFVLWDVLGFFQKSFVEACRGWFGKELVTHLSILDKIEAMKYERDTFSVDRIDEIISYNHAECKLLVLLVQQLFAAMDEADIQLTRYDGAGSIAASLLRRNNILEHGGNQDELCRQSPESYRWSQYAYSGGRIEAPKIGNMEHGTIYRDDINSAYPSACLELPSLAGAYFTMDDEWDGNDYSMAEVEWSLPPNMPFYPLFYRDHRGQITYPRWGTGRYWGHEIRLLKDYFEEGKDYTIRGACNCHLATDARPFTFLRNDYATRLRFKERGSMASEALKLGMNSVYGKLAQQAGYRAGRIPTYHNLYWAGQITSATRARLYRAAMEAPKSIIAFATDAIISTKKLHLDRNTGLGGWTNEKLSGITMVQAGVYWLKLDGVWISKYRGFDKDSLAREDIIQCWSKGENYEAHLTRFYGMGSAVGTRNFTDYWRVWRTEPRTLDLSPKGKRYPAAFTNYHEKLCETDVAPNFADISEGLLSTPYEIAWSDLPGANGRMVKLGANLDEEDIRTYEEELLDSYA
jgi:DNA polymerase type B, organellar and viral